jgi:hypothetical protein
MSFFVAVAGVAFIVLGFTMLANRAGYIYFVANPRTILGLAVIATASFCVLSGARAEEIRPTPQMLDSARQMKKIEFPDDNPSSYEYHFRNLGGHILWCAYATGGNGGFCKKITPAMVSETDRAARDYCRTAGPDDNTPPHAVYGELWDLAYKCSNGRSSRLPVDMALDREGYVRSQWKTLP